MPKNSSNKEKIQSEILTYLSRYGVSSSQSLCQLFKISQPTLSRILSSIKDDILVIGKARETKYAAHRKIIGITLSVPIYEILEDATSRQFGILYPIKPNHFYFEAKTEDGKSAIYPDLPYFLNDLRPTGFLGRSIPKQNQDLFLPNDIHLWTTEHCLIYLSRRAWNGIGNFIVGEESFQLYLRKIQSNTNGIEKKKRRTQYLRYASDALAAGDAGSSAGGDQPKFTTVLLPENKQVIVKFSPPIDSEIGQRIADVLVCEHLALKTLKRYSCDAPNSEVLLYGNQIFLEIERFDRVNPFGRRGLISLATLDAQFTAEISIWSKTATALIKHKIISEDLLEKIRFREIFGAFIANNDMHLYNLSFFTQGQTIIGLAPVYDMSPMLFMPRNNQIIPKEFNPPLPLPDHAQSWIDAYVAATEFWNQVLKDDRISSQFKKIATHCKYQLMPLKNLMKLLPKKS